MKYAMDIHKLYEPLEYNINSGGKDIRRLTILYIQTLLHNKNNPLTDIIIDDINIAHNTSLIIDDIHDSSIKRRGHLCAYLLFGKPLTLNAGYLKCLSLLNNIDKKYPKLIADYVKDLYIDSFVLIISDGLFPSFFNNLPKLIESSGSFKYSIILN